MKKKSEERIIKKAVAIKKKHLLQETVLDELSDEDEIPIEVIKKIQQRKEKKQLPAKPQPVKTKELPPPEPVKPIFHFI